jgi:hypothetical protein
MTYSIHEELRFSNMMDSQKDPSETKDRKHLGSTVKSLLRKTYGSSFRRAGKLSALVHVLQLRIP